MSRTLSLTRRRYHRPTRNRRGQTIETRRREDRYMAATPLERRRSISWSPLPWVRQKNPHVFRRCELRADLIEKPGSGSKLRKWVRASPMRRVYGWTLRRQLALGDHLIAVIGTRMDCNPVYRYSRRNRGNA